MINKAVATKHVATKLINKIVHVAQHVLGIESDRMISDSKKIVTAKL